MCLTIVKFILTLLICFSASTCNAIIPLSYPIGTYQESVFVIEDDKVTITVYYDYDAIKFHNTSPNIHGDMYYKLHLRNLNTINRLLRRVKAYRHTSHYILQPWPVFIGDVEFTMEKKSILP